MIRYLWISVLVIALDQASKVAAARYLIRHAEITLLPFLNLTLTYNTGAAFGFLHDAPGWQNLFFIAVALTASVFIFLWLRRLPANDRLTAIGLSLILGGAIGNLVDRLIHGYVIDFIDVVFGSWHFWTFNVADSAITLGGVLLFFDGLRAIKGSS
jgi:signal peptidase II